MHKGRAGPDQATLRPSGSQPVGTRKPPSGYPQATLRLPQRIKTESADFRWFFLPGEPQLHKPNRCWMPGRVMGASPDTRRPLSGAPLPYTNGSRELDAALTAAGLPQAQLEELGLPGLERDGGQSGLERLFEDVDFIEAADLCGGDDVLCG